MFVIDISGEEPELPVLYSQNVANGPYCEKPEFNPHH